jgi:rubredoxin
MQSTRTIKINFRGGIISPGLLYNILVAVRKARIRTVSFGLRQQLLIEPDAVQYQLLKNELEKLQVHFQINNNDYPNIISSYAAAEVFITNNWLSEGVYKDIFDSFDYRPQLKINIGDSKQSFTPLLTGNINWVASPQQHFWHLFIRFPRTNTVYEWNMLTYTNDICRLSKELEEIIFINPEKFYNNPAANGEKLFSFLGKDQYILKPADQPATLPPFNLPYYEGLNRYNDKYWLGIYRRDESFSVDLLNDICKLCLDTKLGQLCSTPWKSLIIKGIEDKNRNQWNRLLDKYHINVRHAANELNFQVEDNCRAGLQLKQFLVKSMNAGDVRTFGLCFGIKTRRKSEVFSSILIRKRPLIQLGKWEMFFVYDILCASRFNPNERTGTVFSKSNPKLLLPEQLRRAIASFYQQQPEKEKLLPVSKQEKAITVTALPIVFQCKHCLTVYDESTGEPDSNIAAGTAFNNLPGSYRCTVCEAPKEDFVRTTWKASSLQTV